MRREEDKISTAINIEHFCAPVVHPVTGETISKYQTLANDLFTKETWMTAWRKYWGNLAQGDKKTGTEGTDSLFVMSTDDTRNNPNDQTFTYARMVVEYRPQKI